MAYSGDDYEGECGGFILLCDCWVRQVFLFSSLFPVWADILPYKTIDNRLFFHQVGQCCISNTCYRVGAASGKNDRTSGVDLCPVWWIAVF